MRTEPCGGFVDTTHGPLRYASAGSSAPAPMQAVGEEAALALVGLTLAAARYPACPIPTLILSGSADRVALPQLHAMPLARMLPNAELWRLEGLGHMLHHFAVDTVVDAAETLLKAQAV